MSSNGRPQNGSSNADESRQALLELFVGQNFELQGKAYPEKSQITSMARTWDELLLQTIPTEHLQKCWKMAVRNHGDFKYPVTPREVFTEWQHLRTQQQTKRDNIAGDFADPEEVHQFFEQVRQLIRRF